MTIIRKCLLTAAIVLLGVGSVFAQRSDFNVVPYAESFENPAAWGGSSTNINITNGWYSTANDKSAIVALSYTFTNCTVPLTNATQNNVLQLNTGGDTLTNKFDGRSILYAVTYADMMVKFVASETKPAACVAKDNTDSQIGIKTAFYVDTNNCLIVYCGALAPDATIISNVLANTGMQVDTTQWYRVTIAYDSTFVSDDLADVEMFQIYLNGKPVPDNSGHAYAPGWQDYAASQAHLPALSVGGTWFPSACVHGPQNLNAITFQGTGYIDDLVVTNGPVDFGVTYYTLTVVFNSNGGVTDNGVALVSGVPVQVTGGTSPTLVYTAQDWYRIQSLLVSTSGVANAVSAAVNQKTYSHTITSVTGNISNTVTFYQPDGGIINPAFTNIPTAWLSGFGQPESTSPYNNGALSPWQEYLLGINPFIAETSDFKVTSISVAGTSVAVSVSLNVNTQPYSSIKGVLHLYGYSDLSNPGAGAVVGTAALSGGAATFNFTDPTSSKFYRAVIEAPAIE